MNVAPKRLLSFVLVVALVSGGFAAATTTATADSSVLLVHTEVSPTQPTTDANFTVSTAVTNAEDSDSRFAIKRVTVFDENGDERRTQLNETGTEGWVPAGVTKTVNHSVGIDEAGTHELLVRVRLVSPTDGVRTVERTVPVTVRQPHPVLGMQFATTVAGSPTNATVRVANGLDAPVRNVRLSLDPEKTTFRTRSHSFATVGAGAERSVSVGVSGETNGSETVRATLSYDYNGTRYTTTQRLTGEFVQPTNPGRVTLTNLDVEPAGDSLRIRGTASNPGGSNVTGVTVSVRDSETVRPGANSSDFFVGRIGPSDFGTFETQATAEANGTVTVPIHVSYVVDGVERETVRRVTYTQPANDGETEDSSGGLPVELLGGAALVLVGGAVVWRVRGGT